MKIISTLHDNRIMAWNVLAEMTLVEYANLIESNIDKNEFQRRRVSSSKTVYSLLKHDIKHGCIIPPLVLAITENIENLSGLDNDDFLRLIHDKEDSIIILDGLQRTHTILDLLEEVKGTDSENSVKKMNVRIEIYIGINRIGILYRMLTLNTGQTPMSLRQQIEMLYADQKDIGSEIKLVREVDARSAVELGEFNFKDVLEGFNAYLNRDELPLDRSGLLENIKSLEKLSRENQNNDIFEKYTTLLDALIRKIVDITGNIVVESQSFDGGTPFGTTALKIFRRPQAMSGFGAAIGKLLDRGKLESLDSVADLISRLHASNPEDLLDEVNTSMAWIKNNSKKIGNAQRIYFTYYFRELFNDDTDSFLNLKEAASSALRKYQDQNA